MEPHRLCLLCCLLAGCGPNVSLEPSGHGSSGELGSSTGTSSESATPTTAADSGTSVLPEQTSSSSGGPIACDSPSSCEACQSWRDEFDGPSGDQDWFASLLFAPNGDVVAVGTQNSSFLEAAGAEARVVRYAADGTMVWERVLDGTPLQAVSGAFDDDGSIDVVVAHQQGSIDADTWLARLGGDGEVLRDAAPLVESTPRQLQRTDSGDLLLLSRSRGELDDVGLSRIVDGIAEPIGPAELQDFAGGTTILSLGASGSVFIAGETDDGAPRLRRLSPDGADWIVDGVVDVFEGFTGEGRVVDVRTLEDGSAIYAIGARTAPIRVGRLDPLGLAVWAADVEGLPCCDLEPVQLTTDAQGRVFLLVGASNAAERVVAISPCDGSTLWTWEEDESKSRSFGKAIISGTEGLFVAGSRGAMGTDSMAWIVGFEL